jgi:TetR/AcrR family transcriptional regulator, regulator of biofilm formation and stress response
VVERDGVAGVTHRTVAREAGVPASAATYYFATLDDLLVAALTSATADYVSRLHEAIAPRAGDIAGADVDRVASALTHYLARSRALVAAGCELYLVAARRPALRPAALEGSRAIGDLALRYTDDPVTVAALTTATDGFFVQALVSDDPPDAAEFARILRHILGLPVG